MKIAKKYLFLWILKNIWSGQTMLADRSLFIVQKLVGNAKNGQFGGFFENSLKSTFLGIFN